MHDIIAGSSPATFTSDPVRGCAGLPGELKMIGCFPFLLYPRLRIPTFIPRALKRCASHNTVGVLPVPPTVMLPTLITGRSNERDGSQPIEYRWFLRIVTSK